MIHQGHCLDVLRRLPTASVQCVVTSPPYWSLRDYGVPPSVWGGQSSCEHSWESAGRQDGYATKQKWQHGEYHGKARKAYDAAGAQDPSAVKARILAGMRERITVDWKPTCRCTLRTVVPCVVVDPFAGAATTGLVADRLGREFIGIELNPDYVRIGESRRSPRRAEASA